MEMSKHAMRGGNVAGLLECFAQLREKARMRTGKSSHLSSSRRQASTRFRVHQVSQAEEIESHVLDPASITSSCQRRQAKTYEIDNQALIRAPLGVRARRLRCAIIPVPHPRRKIAFASVASRVMWGARVGRDGGMHGARRARVSERWMAEPCVDAFEGQCTDISVGGHWRQLHTSGGKPCIFNRRAGTKPTAKESRGGYWSLYRSKCLFNRRYGLRTNFAVYV
jgi:hypothetical protein